jgi:hypothetical protein
MNRFFIKYDGRWHVRHGTWFQSRWYQFWWFGRGRFALEINVNSRTHFAISDWRLLIHIFGRYLVIMNLRPLYRLPVVKFGRAEVIP